MKTDERAKKLVFFVVSLGLYDSGMNKKVIFLSFRSRVKRPAEVM